MLGQEMIGEVIASTDAGEISTGVLDADFDCSIREDFSNPLNKPKGKMANDLFWNSISNFGSATFSKYPSFFKNTGSTMIFAPFTTINRISNDELGY